MKTMAILSIVAAGLLWVGSAVASTQYYYSANQQIPLYIDSNKITIFFDPEWPYNSEDIIQQYERIDSLIESEIAPDGFKIYALSDPSNLDLFIDTLLMDSRIDFVNPYYILCPNVPSLIGRTFCCKFAENVSQEFIDSLNAANHVQITSENEYAPNQFFMSIQAEALNSTLEIANLYYELPETDFCHPNFLGCYEFTEYRIYDHYWDEQWAMHRVFEAWPDSQPDHKAFQITQGDSNIIIAVIDMGVASHEDLPPDRLVPGYDFEAMDDDPTPCDQPLQGWHGMGVAGIIGSSHNRIDTLLSDSSTGIYGMAPKCKIMPIKIGSGWGFHVPPHCNGYVIVDDQRVSASISWAWANGADIISCSWNRYGHADVLEYAIRQAAAVGRDGKGCGIFYAAGNTGTDTVIICPQEMPEVITIGAIKPNDSIWDYSSYNKVDVVAPSGRSAASPIWTLDQMGLPGIDCRYDLDYDCSFGGTSAAQPVAAGVGALVLSRRPDLTKAQLDSVIKFSADPNLYDTIASPPDQKYGYGMVHPLRALLAVCRGDADNSGRINSLDVTYLINFLYKNRPAPVPDTLMGDVDYTGAVNALDVTFLIDYLYKEGPGPAICFDYGS